MNRLVRVARTVCRGSAITAVARPATMAFRPAQVSVFQASRSFSEATAGDEVFRALICITYTLTYIVCVLVQPFLDTKMVAERIIEVVKNFEKVLKRLSYTLCVLLHLTQFECDVVYRWTITRWGPTRTSRTTWTWTRWTRSRW